MPDITATYHLDVSNVQAAFANVEALGKRAAASVNSGGGAGAFRAQSAGAAKAAQGFAAVRQQSDKARQSLSATGTSASRAFAVLTTAGRAGEAVHNLAAGYRTATRLVRQFSKEGAAAANVMRMKAAAVRLASTAQAAFNTRLGKVVAVAGVAAAGIWGVTRAWRALSGSRKPDLSLTPPKVSGAGGGGMGMGMGMGMKAGIAGAALGAAALGTMVFGAVKKGMTQAITSAAEMEQVEISFEVMTGGIDTGRELLGEIRDMAENTPFQLAGLAEAGKTLLAFGLEADTVTQRLRMLGDIAGGNQKKMDMAALAFGQIASAGRLMGQDLLQLINLGFNPLQTIAERTGESMIALKKRMEQGLIPFAEVEAAFVAATSEGGRFFEMTEKQSGTLVGLFSTLKDRIEQAFVAMGSPINDAIRPLLERAVELTETLGTHFEAVGKKIASAINFLHAFFTELSAGDMLASVGAALEVAFLKAIDTLARGIQAIYASSKDGAFMDGLAEKLRGMGVILHTALLGAVQGVFAALSKVKGMGFLEGAADGLGVARQEAKLDEANRRRRAREEGRTAPEEDLMGAFKENFRSASGVFGTEIAAAQSRLGQVLAPVWAEQARLLADQQGSDAPGGTGRGGGAGEMIAAAGRGSVAAGAFQQAKNLLLGKTVNEMVAEETKKTNDQLGKLASGQEKVRGAIEKVEKAITKGRAPSVEVVPTF